MNNSFSLVTFHFTDGEAINIRLTDGFKYSPGIKLSIGTVKWPGHPGKLYFTEILSHQR